MGVIVTTRPDSLKLYFGHNSVLDIRAKYVPLEKLVSFEEIGPSSRGATVGGLTPATRWPSSPSTHAPAALVLRIAAGAMQNCSAISCTWTVRGEPQTLQVFTDLGGDHLWMRMVDAPLPRRHAVPGVTRPSGGRVRVFLSPACWRSASRLSGLNRTVRRRAPTSFPANVLRCPTWRKASSWIARE